MKPKLSEAQAQRAYLHAERKRTAAMDAASRALRALRKVCTHSRLVECDYQSMHFGSALPPRRVCKDCGLVEDGWGCGYDLLRQPDEYAQSLRERIPLVSRETVSRYVRYLDERI